MPLPLGTTFPRPFSGYRLPKKKSRFPLPTRPGPRVYVVSVVDSVTISDSIRVGRNVQFFVNQSVSISDSIAKTRSYSFSLSDSVTTSQIVFKLGKITTLTVEHDVTVVQTIKLNKIVQFRLTDTVTTAQVARQDQSVQHSVTITDSIRLNRVLNRAFVDNVAITQGPFVNSPRVFSVYDNVSIIDTFSARLATFRFNITDNVTIDDSLTERLGTYRVSMSDSVTISEFIRQIGAIYRYSLADSVSVVSQVNRQVALNVVHDVALFQVFSKHREVTRTITTALTDTDNFGRDASYTLTTQLNLTSEFTRSVIYNRTLVELATPTSNFDALLFIPNPGPHPVVSGINIVYGYMTLLESPYGTVVLPIPELNDSHRNNDSVDIKRSMSGKLTSYVKRSNREILTYTWMLDYPKALELKLWALNNKNFAQPITLTNWKGEVWSVSIISDDLSLRAETKYQGYARQKTSVTLQFEGVKIYG